MKFGINTFLWTANFGLANFGLLNTIREHGFSGVEVAVFEPSSFPATEIRRALAQTNLECTAVSVIPKHLSILSSDPGVRKSTVEHLRACIAATAEVGSRILAGPLYSPVGFLTHAGLP